MSKDKVKDLKKVSREVYGPMPGKVVPSKRKYTRKEKHKKQENPDSHR